jgi:hypothetical protein
LLDLAFPEEESSISRNQRAPFAEIGQRIVVTSAS